MLEIVDEIMLVMLFIGEDEQWLLVEWVVKLLLKICVNYIIIDLKVYEFLGISEKYCGWVILFFLMYVVM